ncbi:MAG TPA: hypothetical protein VEU72_07675 [Nitrosopumilaceae archaeon]|jgi:hypothetical protein|nr:hypothetical protein [Nitrosopumilaceae archaeon]
MKGTQIFLFVFVMWVLIIVGGGLLISIIAPLTINGHGKFDSILDSGVKALIAMILVVVWIFILSKIKNWIFHKQIKN